MLDESSCLYLCLLFSLLVLSIACDMHVVAEFSVCMPVSLCVSMCLGQSLHSASNQQLVPLSLILVMLPCEPPGHLIAENCILKFSVKCVFLYQSSEGLFLTLPPAFVSVDNELGAL